MMSSSAKVSGNEHAAEMVRIHTNRAGYLLKRSEQTLTSIYFDKNRTTRNKLTFSQLILLCAIDAAPGSHQAVTARMTGMDTPTTTVVTKSLVKHGLIDRTHSQQDRRHRLLIITAAGKAARKAAYKHLAEAQEKFLKPIKKRDQQRLLELLLSISSNPNASAPPLCNRYGQSITTPDYLQSEVLIAFLISRCLQIAISIVTPALVPFGLSIGQYVTLFVLTTFEECNLAALSRSLGRERTSLSLILTALEDRSLINIRQRGRSLAISPTKAGNKLFLQARIKAEIANEQILSGLSHNEVMDFTRILKETLRYHNKLMPDEITG